MVQQTRERTLGSEYVRYKQNYSIKEWYREVNETHNSNKYHENQQFCSVKWQPTTAQRQKPKLINGREFEVSNRERKYEQRTLLASLPMIATNHKNK